MIKRDLTAYLVNSANEQYTLRVYADVSYSQVFTEQEIPLKTLHNPENLISDGITSGKQPGNFNFTLAILDSTLIQALFTLFLQNEPEVFDVYYDENSIIKHLSSCVVSGITFNFAKNDIITATISGTFSDTLTVGSVPGTPQAASEVFTYIEGINLIINSTTINYIESFSVEVSNNIQWLQNRYMHDTTVNAREDFVCTGKTISGNIVQNTDLTSPSYNDNIDIEIQIQHNGSLFLEFDFPDSIVTSRPQLGEIIKRGYDFRVTNNANNEIRYKGVNII